MSVNLATLFHTQRREGFSGLLFVPSSKRFLICLCFFRHKVSQGFWRFATLATLRHLRHLR